MKRSPAFLVLLIAILILNIHCKKETTFKLIDPPPFASAGTNQSEIEEFQVTLNADSLHQGQTGKWTIEKGLIEKKVKFADDTRPDTKFNGMPGESYELKWTVTTGPTKTSEAIVKISFKPLKAVISNHSPNNSTKFALSGNMYEDGEWSIEGKYAFLRSQIHGGIEVPILKSPSVLLQGYAHSTYKITWTARYGSKSASVTMNIKTGDYLETEALADLDIDRNSNLLGWENGHVIKLNLNASGYGGRFDDTLEYPALQGLKYLKHLNFQGSSVKSFPEMLGERCKDLETLNFDGSLISFVPSNIGKLKKLRILQMEHPNWGMKVRSLPESLGDLESLEVLLVKGLGLESLPESMSKLKNLRHLEVYHNDIVRLPFNIGNLTMLEELWANTKENLPASAPQLKNLRRLYFITRASNAVLPDNIGDMSRLDTLEIQGNFSSIPASIGKLNIKYLSIESAVLASVPNSIGNLKKLESLSMGGVITSLPATITELTNLKYMYISSSQFRSLPSDINKLSKLEALTAGNAYLREIPSTIGDLQHLTFLRLNDNQIEFLPANFYNLPKLTELYLNNNKFKGIPADFSKLAGSLRSLGLTGNNYSVEDISVLKKLLPNTYITY